MRRQRLAGWGLLAYGAAGVILVVGGAIVGLDAAGRVERLAAAADGTLTAAAESVRAAADAFRGVDGSLAESQASAAGGAELSRDASETLDELSDAMRLSFLGAQPLLPLAGDFATSAEQASALADTLDRVAGSLDRTRADVEDIGTELRALGTQLEVLRGEAAASGSAPPLRALVLMLLAWLLVPAIGALVAGAALLGLVPRTVRPATPPGA